METVAEEKGFVISEKDDYTFSNPEYDGPPQQTMKLKEHAL